MTLKLSHVQTQTHTGVLSGPHAVGERNGRRQQTIKRSSTASPDTISINPVSQSDPRVLKIGLRAPSD